MTNLTKLLIGAGIVGAGVITTPIIYNNQINKFIKQEKTNLQAQQIELKETKNSDSFFDAKREYIVTIKDITPIIQKIYPQIDFYSLRNLKESFDNTKFLVTLDMLKLPLYHKDAIKIDLYSLNQNTKTALSNDKIGKELLEAIKNRAFEIILDINNLEVSKAKLKDIDLSLENITKYKIEKFNIKTKNSVFDVENSNLKISKITTNYNKKSEYSNKTINFDINNINFKTKRQDLLNNSSMLKISSIDYKEKYKYNDLNLHISDISNSSSTKTITNKTSMNNKIEIKSISLNNNKDHIKVDNFKYNLHILNLNAPALKQIVDMINNNNLENTQKLIKNLNKLVQKGFKIYISPLSIDGVKGKIDNQNFDIKPIKINFDATLSPNNFNLINNIPAYLINYINAKLEINTYKENIDLLNQKNFQIGMLINKIISKKTNNKVFLKIEYNKGRITSNGKSLF